MKKIYYDPALLSLEDALGPHRPDPEVALAVRRAIGRLPARQREVIEARFNEGLTFRQIAARLGLTSRAAQAEHYAAVRALRHQLAQFVAKRWGIEAGGLCRICGHPKRSEIEGMLLTRGSRETWGAFGKRLEREIGERIHPPRILISHLKHMGDAHGRCRR